MTNMSKDTDLDFEVEEKPKWRAYWEKNMLQVALGVAGIVLLIGGGIWALQGDTKGGSVEIISGENNEEKVMTSDKIWVDIEGAVEKPGVYELTLGARIDNVLTAAGGLAANCDRNWVKRNINLAQKIPDGAKIYIPTEGEADSNTRTTSSTSSTGSIGSTGEVAGVATMGLVSDVSGAVNINSAGKSELDKLWGIGETRAEAIINNRPYNNIEELLTKAGIPKNVFDRIKGQIAVY